jgi:hypothetical protein
MGDFGEEFCATAATVSTQESRKIRVRIWGLVR